MSQTVVIHARIDPSTKEATERVLETLGLTPTEAIRLLYRQIAIRGEFPLELMVPTAVINSKRSAVNRIDGRGGYKTAEDIPGKPFPKGHWESLDSPVTNGDSTEYISEDRDR